MRRNRSSIGMLENTRKSQPVTYAPVRGSAKRAESLKWQSGQNINSSSTSSGGGGGGGGGGGRKQRRPLLSQQQQAHRLIKQARSNKATEMLPVIINALRVVRDALHEEAHVKLMVDDHGCGDVCHTMQIYLDDGAVQLLGLEILARLTYRGSLQAMLSTPQTPSHGKPKLSLPAVAPRNDPKSASNVLRAMKMIQAGGLPLSLTAAQRFHDQPAVLASALTVWTNCVECFKHMKASFSALIPAACHAMEAMPGDALVQKRGQQLLAEFHMPNVKAALHSEEFEPELGSWKIFMRGYSAVQHHIADLAAAALEEMLKFLQEPQNILGKHDPLMHHVYSVQACTPFLVQSVVRNFTKSESANLQSLCVLHEVAHHSEDVRLYLVRGGYVNLIGEILDTHEHACTVRACGLKLLGLLLRDQPELCDQILSDGSAVLRHLTTPLENVHDAEERSLVVQVLSCLSEIVQSSTDGGARLAHEWKLVLSPCRDALQQFVEDPEIQVAAIRVIMALSVTREKRVRQRVADVFGIPALCTFHERPAQQTKMRDFCSKCLKTLGFAHFAIAAESVTAAPFIEAWRLCSALRHASGREETSEALIAAREFAGHDESHRNAIDLSGGVTLICGAVRAFSESAWVVYHGLWGLAYVTYGRDERALDVMHSGGLTLALDCMVRHPGHAGVQQNALWVLANVAQQEVACIEIVNSEKLGALPLVQSVLQKHVANPRVQEQGMLLVSNLLCMESDDIKNTLMLTTLPEVMLEAASHHERDDRAMLAILLAMGNMGSHWEQQWRCEAAPLPKLPGFIACAVQNYPHNPELHRYAFRALEKFISKNPSLLESVPMREAVKGIVESVFAHTGDRLLQGYATKLLRVLHFESPFAARKWVLNQNSVEQKKRQEQRRHAQQQQQQQQQQERQQPRADMTLTTKQRNERAAAQQKQAEQTEARRHKPHASLAPMPMTYSDALNLEMAMARARQPSVAQKWTSPKSKDDKLALPSLLSPKTSGLEEPLEFFNSTSQSMLGFMKHNPLPPPSSDPPKGWAPPIETPIGSHERSSNSNGNSNRSSREGRLVSTKGDAGSSDKNNRTLERHHAENLQWMSAVVPLSKNWTAPQVALVRPLVGQLGAKQKTKDPFGPGRTASLFD